MLLKGKKEQDRSVCKKHPQERQFNMFFFLYFFCFQYRWNQLGVRVAKEGVCSEFHFTLCR